MSIYLSPFRLFECQVIYCIVLSNINNILTCVYKLAHFNSRLQ